MKTSALILGSCLAFLAGCSASQNLGSNDGPASAGDGGTLDGSSVHGDGDGDGDHADMDGGVSGDAGTNVPVGMGTGSVLFRWTFQNGTESCAEAGVRNVSLDFAGQYLVLPCRTAAGQSARVTGLMQGSQYYTVSVFGGATGSFAQVMGQVGVLDGKETIVDVPVVLTKDGGVDFQWTFDHGKTCVQVGASHVQVQIDGRNHTFPCKAKDGEHGTITGIYAAQKNFTLLGLKNGKIIAKTGGQVAVTKDMTAPFPVDIPLVNATNTGSLALDFYIYKNNVGSCHELQSPYIGVAFGNYESISFPCLDPDRHGYRGAILDLLPPGDIIVQAYDGSARTFTVVAGQQTKAQIYAGDGMNVQMGSVLFMPKFMGKTCAQAGVTQVHVHMTGFTSDTDQQVACGDQGIVPMMDVYGSDLDYTLTATGKGGAMYTGQGHFSSNYGAHPIHVDLQNTWSDTGNGTVTADFRFGPRGDTCKTLGLDHVHVFASDFDDKLVPGSEKTVACKDLPLTLTLPAGSHDINVEGLRGTYREYLDEFVNVAVSGNGKHNVLIAVDPR
jgi:hypothetical protein